MSAQVHRIFSEPHNYPSSRIWTLHHMHKNVWRHRNLVSEKIFQICFRPPSRTETYARSFSYTFQGWIPDPASCRWRMSAQASCSARMTIDSMLPGARWRRLRAYAGTSVGDSHTAMEQLGRGGQSDWSRAWLNSFRARSHERRATGPGVKPDRLRRNRHERPSADSRQRTGPSGDDHRRRPP